MSDSIYFPFFTGLCDVVINGLFVTFRIIRMSNVAVQPFNRLCLVFNNTDYVFERNRGNRRFRGVFNLEPVMNERRATGPTALTRYPVSRNVGYDFITYH